MYEVGYLLYDLFVDILYWVNWSFVENICFLWCGGLIWCKAYGQLHFEVLPFFLQNFLNEDEEVRR